jgi:hypothetical protein
MHSVLGKNDSAPFSKRSRIDANQYAIEYAVKVPEQQPEAFVDWMAAARKAPMTVSSRSYGHESAYREVNDNGRDAGELFERFSIEP